MNIQLIHNELIHKLRNFFADCSCDQAVVALSGGIDSAVVVALAVEALGADKIHTVLLPSRFSSAGSVADSVAMVQKLGVKYDILDIDPIFEKSIATLAPLFDAFACGTTSENIQSRIRGMLTMAVANATGALMLNTSNRSEILIGYGTLYGDMGGAVGVIASLYKGEVYELAQYINDNKGHIIPQIIIDKAPSAELRANQKDSDALPAYPILDDILHRMVDLGQSVIRLSKEYPAAIVCRIEQLHRQSAFKRLQLPPAL